MLRHTSLRFRLLGVSFLALFSMLLVSLTLLHSQKQALTEARMQQVQFLVESAHSALTYIDKQAQNGKISAEEARRIGQEILNTGRYGQHGEFFAFDKNMIETASGLPQFIGSDLKKVVTPEGLNLGEAWQKAVASGEGFLHYSFPREEKGPSLPKIGYGKLFEPWGWYICTGVYIDDINEQFWSGARNAILLLSLVSAAMIVAMLLISNRILRQLGGEPGYATHCIRKIAGGDLTTRIDIKAGDDRSLLASISGMQQQLADMITRIRQQVILLNEYAAEIHHAADHVASGSARQSDAGTAMASAIEEMTVSINHISDNAASALSITQQSVQDSTDAAGVIHKASTEIGQMADQVNETAGSLRTLGDHIGDISRIVSVIKEIAEQTNLLALNAAIEAARAGEQGRGFAVVADEVRKLSERTSLSTQEISQMIESVQRSAQDAITVMHTSVSRVETGVQLAEESGRAMSGIQGHAGKVVSVTHAISDALREQSQASNEIAGQVERIAQMAEENSVAAKRAGDATHHMEELAHELQNLVSQFKA